jgi:hypothetical protein
LALKNISSFAPTLTSKEKPGSAYGMRQAMTKSTLKQLAFVEPKAGDSAHWLKFRPPRRLELNGAPMAGLPTESTMLPQRSLFQCRLLDGMGVVMTI